MKLESIDRALNIIGGFLLFVAAIIAVVGIMGSVILMLVDFGFLLAILSVYLIQEWVRKRNKHVK
jgi:hypothetical protein